MAGKATYKELERRIKVLEKELAEERALVETLSLALGTTNATIWYWNIKDDEVYTDPRFVDVLGYNRWTKMGIIFGANAITIYSLSGILPDLTGAKWFNGESMKSLYFSHLVDIGITPEIVSLSYAVLFTLICFVPAYYLYKKKIFIKV